MGGRLVRAVRGRRARDRARPHVAGAREGRPDRDPRQHAARVGLRLLRDPDGRRRIGLDLPDQLAQRGPVRRQPLRVEGDLRRGRRAAREGPQVPCRPAAPRAHRHLRAERRLIRGRRLAGRAARPRPRGRRRQARGAHEFRDPRRPGDLHLHLRHDRAAQGRHAHARQLPPGHQHERVTGHVQHRRPGLPVPSARSRVRAARAVRRDRPWRADRVLGEGRVEDRPEPDGAQADVLPVGAADLREDLHDGPLGGSRPGAARQGCRARPPGAPDAGAGR